MFSRRIFGALLVGFLGTGALAVEIGDDGLHKTDWMRETFKDLREDLEEANAEGKRLLVIIEQRGCIYCTRMHEQIFPDPDITAALTDDYFVVQLNMFGDVEVSDFDGTIMAEKDIVRRWNALFTPTMMFFPSEVPEDASAVQAAVAVMPGAFERGTTLNLLNWVRDEGYLEEEPFQKYNARMLGDG